MLKILFIPTLMLCLAAQAKSIPTKKEVYQEIVNAGIKFADITLAQAILESGNFKSKIALQNNNLFGMRLAKSRKTTAVGQKSGYAIYLSWKESIKDFKLWQDRLLKKNPNITRSQYLNYLNRIYSETSNYVVRVKLITQINKNKYEKDSIYSSNGRANDSMRIIN